MIKNVFNSHLIFQHQIVFIMFLKEMNEYFLGFNLIIWYTILQILHFFSFHGNISLITRNPWRILYYYDDVNCMASYMINIQMQKKKFNYKYRFRGGLFLEEGGGQNCAQSAKNYFLPPPWRPCCPPPLIIRPYSS